MSAPDPVSTPAPAAAAPVAAKLPAAKLPANRQDADRSPCCGECDAPVVPGDRFCEDCGHRLAGCTACGGAVDAEGFCKVCGRRQASVREQEETVLPGGAAGVTDQGYRRSRNEDAMALRAAGGHTVGVVCDGVSSSPRAHLAAVAAAQRGADAIAAELDAGRGPEEATRTAAGRAAEAVAALATSGDDVPACTYVSAVAGDGQVTVGWIGDSRAYWLPEGGAAELLTTDDATTRGILSAWLGADAPEPGVHVHSFTPEAAGLLLACSDGLWGYLPDPGAVRAALPDPPGAPLERARALVRHALAAGGHDNVTVLTIPVAGPGEDRERPQPVPREGGSK